MASQIDASRASGSAGNTQPRPRFTPSAIGIEDADLSTADEPGWIDVISAPCYVSLRVMLVQNPIPNGLAEG